MIGKDLRPNIINNFFSLFFQFFSGTEYAQLFPEDYESKLWKLCMRTITSDSEYSI